MTNKLFLIPKPNPAATLRVFCFPYAGGAPSIFMSWVDQLPAHVELVAVQLPGRGSRLMEPAHASMSAIIDELNIYQPFFSQKPCVFFGHSLGSRIAFEFAKNLHIKNRALPLKIIASASRAPHLKSNKKPFYHLPDADFIAQLKSLNGTPKEILESSELMALFLPLLRADFEIADCYQAAVHTLPVPIDILYGLDDIDITPEQIDAWQTLSAHPITKSPFNGDHFFINALSSEVCCKVNELITAL
ncbi:alpha/beta fold hydrolase [Pseudoalteromonas sp. SMS1]|uniref:thioesterase II family protein n=1 Tax=Pseudoalteromonas sp. SMS1 TaxID=2908894 RepID=UPI001F3A4B2C|nr:alpha/beta fold hydrolase [Pseudoalteromonas sp. SMS1]MCF2856605.1 alpha/beta fold hydrolase [Pseudoalteromonas sp. SMS1]